jgi:hypothetical protein
MHYFANLIYSHPSHELIERGGAIGTRAVFNLDDGSKLASAVKPLWTNTQHWEKVVFAAVLWAGGSSHFPHVDACHTTFKLYDTHGDIARSRGAQHEDGPEFHWFNARGYRGRVVILAFVFTDSAIDEQYINYIDGISGDKVTKGNTLSQGHMSGGTNSAYLDGDLKSKDCNHGIMLPQVWRCRMWSHHYSHERTCYSLEHLRVIHHSRCYIRCSFTSFIG